MSIADDIYAVYEAKKRYETALDAKETYEVRESLARDVSRAERMLVSRMRDIARDVRSED